MSAPVPLMTGTALSQDHGIPTSGGNPASYVQDNGRNNKSPIPPDSEPWLDLGPIGRGSEILLN